MAEAFMDQSLLHQLYGMLFYTQLEILLFGVVREYHYFSDYNNPVLWWLTNSGSCCPKIKYNIFKSMSKLQFWSGTFNKLSETSLYHCIILSLTIDNMGFSLVNTSH